MEEEIRNDQELYSYYRDRTTTLTKDNFMYLMSHPEVKRLLNDYLSNILLHKPDDVFKFTKDYFKFLSDKGESDKFVILVGPNSVGKTTLINKILGTNAPTGNVDPIIMPTVAYKNDKKCLF